MSDGNTRDVFVLCIGRCGHKWAVPTRAFVAACPVCGDIDRDAKHVKCEPLNVSMPARAHDPVPPRKTAEEVLLAKRRRDRAAGLEP